MTGVIDRYAVISEHLHYNPSFDVDNESERVARNSAVIKGSGYLDVAKDPEEERERSESRMAVESERTSEIVFETGGQGSRGSDNDRSDDFKFELGGSDFGAASRRASRLKDKPIDLRTGTRLSTCPSCNCLCGWKMGAVFFIAAIITAGVVLIVLGILAV
mmetsp:Transcript_16012/g.41453  ORF Transcript_16012/g.41453 Transcript_16012/m.41453 type:complete len:161 (+) Transcript_16012:216-698(+)